MKKALFKDWPILSHLALILIIGYLLISVLHLAPTLFGYGQEGLPLLLATILFSVVVFGGGAVWQAFLFSDRPTSFLGLQPYQTDWRKAVLLLLSYAGCLLAVVLTTKGVKLLLPFLPPAWQEEIDRSGAHYTSLIKEMLQGGKGWALLAIAIIPGITEELFFRGAVLRLTRRVTRNRWHAAVWLTAIVFSIAHLDLMGFFPRIVLGAYLGYVYYHTRSIYVPMALHVLNNAIALCSLSLDR